MIESIQLQNYKAFSDVTIPLRPLTILLGANSVGKSSIIQMLLLLHQTAEEKGFSYSSALKIYGNYVNAGAYENLFKGRNTNIPLCLSLDFESQDLLHMIKRMKDDYLSDLHRLCYYLPLSESRDFFDFNINNEKDFKKYIDGILKVYKKRDDDYHLFSYRFKKLGISEYEINKTTHSSIYRTYDFLSRLNESTKESTNTLTIKFEMRIVHESFVISSLSILSTNFNGDKTQIIDIKYSPDNRITVSSDLINFTRTDQNKFKYYFNHNHTIFDCIISDGARDDISSNSGIKESTLVCVIMKLIYRIVSQLKTEFSGSKVNYVSPLRANPKRYYFLDKANTTISLDTLDGDAIAEVLKDNANVLKKVNDWFKSFGLRFNVQELKEVIHHLKVSQNGLTLDITDVGFGISQILPIIIQGFLSLDNSTTIIEQPEIHLHPKMQADLGDLFIDIISNKNNTKKLVIETHSEYLLKRIRRRISEGKIAPTDVSICLFHPKTKEKDAWVQFLNIEEKGNFEWPEEFYGGELFNDTIVFLKNQK